MPSFFRFSTRHTASHRSFRAWPLALLFRELQRMLYSHVCAQTSCMIQLTAHVTLEFAEAPFFAVGILWTMVPLMFIHAFSCAQLAAIQALCVTGRTFSRSLRHVFLRSVDYSTSMGAASSSHASCAVCPRCFRIDLALCLHPIAQPLARDCGSVHLNIPCGTGPLL